MCTEKGGDQREYLGWTDMPDDFDPEKPGLRTSGEKLELL